jgi:hypothetical protein
MRTDSLEIKSELRPNAFTADDVEGILRARNWLDGAASPECAKWMADAAALLGPHAPDAGALSDLLSLVFTYDVRAAMQLPENQAVMSREYARTVIRELAHRLLEIESLDSDRLKEIVSTLKEQTTTRHRELFGPLRLALAGRAGEGELDRVILLLDRAAALGFAAPVKGTRARILEFCAALD